MAQGSSGRQAQDAPVTASSAPAWLVLAPLICRTSLGTPPPCYLPGPAPTGHCLRVQAEGASACVFRQSEPEPYHSCCGLAPSSPLRGSWTSRRQADNLRFFHPRPTTPRALCLVAGSGPQGQLQPRGSWCRKGLQTSFCISVPGTRPFQRQPLGPRKLPKGSRGLEPA